MKGGSATKIVLETLCTLGVAWAERLDSDDRSSSSSSSSSSHAQLAQCVRDCFVQYEVAVRHVYSQPQSTAGMAQLIEAAARALNRRVPLEGPPPLPPPPAAPAPRRFVSPTGRGRVLYVGVGTAGILGLIDASECTPTYGSLFNDVRGFVAGGWATMANKQGVVALPMPAHLRGDAGLPASAGTTEEIALDVRSFVADFGPTLSPADCVMLLYIAEHCGGGASDAPGAQLELAQLHEAVAALEMAQAAGAALCHALVLPAGPAPPAMLADVLARVAALAPTGATVRLPSLSLRLEADSAAALAAPAGGGSGGGGGGGAAPAFLGQLALKLLLNATTTGAHIRTGTIYRNRMVQVMLTNTKLFHRAVGIVADVAGVSRALAERCVVRAIYGVDEEDEAPGAAGAAGGGGAAALQLSSLLDAATTPVSAHVKAASTRKGVVPLAIMLAVDGARDRLREGAAAAAAAPAGMTVAQAAALLADEPVVRKAIAAAVRA